MDTAPVPTVKQLFFFCKHIFLPSVQFEMCSVFPSEKAAIAFDVGIVSTYENGNALLTR